LELAGSEADEEVPSISGSRVEELPKAGQPSIMNSAQIIGSPAMDEILSNWVKAGKLCRKSQTLETKASAGRALWGLPVVGAALHAAGVVELGRQECIFGKRHQWRRKGRKARLI